MRCHLTLLLAGALAVSAAPLLATGSTVRAGGSVPAVTTLANGGPGSLRVVVIAANSVAGPSTIALGVGVYRLDINGFLDGIAVSGDFDVLEPLTIEGAGRDVTSMDAQSMGERAFEVLGSGALTLRNLTIRTGSTNTVGGAFNSLSQKRLTLEHVTLDSNKAVGYSGAIAADGPLTIGDSTFSANASTGAGQVEGAIWFGSAGGTSIITASASSETVRPATPARSQGAGCRW